MRSLSEELTQYGAVVITGGSSGIGKSFIGALATLHPGLVICNLSRSVPDINLSLLNLCHVPCDLAEPGAISRSVDEVFRLLGEKAPAGGILLINNSGFGNYGRFEEVGCAGHLGMIDVNVRAVVELTARLMPLLKARGGAILTVASVAAFQPTPYLATYGATKAFVLHWSLALNEELRGTGVRALALCPGPTSTAFFKRAGLQEGAVSDGFGQTAEEVVEEALQALARGRAQVVTGWKNKLMAAVASRLPKPFAARVGAAIFEPLPAEAGEAMSREDYPIRACAWPPRGAPREGTVRMIAPEEVPSWILHEDERLLVLGKPGDVVCHPSKAGPWSSLVGAAREYTRLPTVHLVFRLDRETSGVIVLAKDARMASRLQKAMQERRVGKRYQAVVWGEFREAVTVDQPLGTDTASPVFIKSAVGTGPDSQTAVTHFRPLATGGGFSLVEAVLETGRKHQIRAHAQWLGYPVVGDKIYGPSDRCYLDFIDHGWTPALEEKLLLPRQALHCAEIDLTPAGLPFVFRAPLPEDLRAFCAAKGISAVELPPVRPAPPSPPPPAS